MVKFRTQINPHGQVYLPKEIREELNAKQIEILGNARAIVIYASGTEPSEVLRSLRVVVEDLKHRRELAEKEKEGPP
jgi:bifunctional DNA-binding transcriptional regulator/antitoxin component of YhaV-PrlF toxin-antitoxin module